MPKVNVFANRRQTLEYQTFGPFFEPDDEKDEHQHYTFRLRPLDDIEKEHAKAFGELLTARHCTGGYLTEEGETRDKPQLMTLGDGQSVIEATPDLMQWCAEVERMQGIKRGLFEGDMDPLMFDGYTARELCVIAATKPTVWAELRFAVRKKRAEPYQKKTKDSDGPSSAPGSAAD